MSEILARARVLTALESEAVAASNEGVDLDFLSRSGMV